MPLIRRQPVVLNFPTPHHARPLPAAAAAGLERGALLALRQQLPCAGQPPAGPELRQALQRLGWADEQQALRALIDQVLATAAPAAPPERPYVPY